MKRILLNLFALTLGIVCVLDGAEAQRSFVYRCADGTQLTATFIEMKAVRLQFADRKLVLPLRRSASGSRYADESLTFWIRGDSAMLTRGDIMTECMTNPG